MTIKQLELIKRSLDILILCPPTIGRIMENEDAIEASGLDPWCLNEGKCDSEDTNLPWFVWDLRNEVVAEIKQLENEAL